MMIPQYNPETKRGLGVVLIEGGIGNAFRELLYEQYKNVVQWQKNKQIYEEDLYGNSYIMTPLKEIRWETENNGTSWSITQADYLKPIVGHMRIVFVTDIIDGQPVSFYQLRTDVWHYREFQSFVEKKAPYCKMLDMQDALSLFNSHQYSVEVIREKTEEQRKRKRQKRLEIVDENHDDQTSRISSSSSENDSYPLIPLIQFNKN